jgi:hypothetical protein
MKKNIFCKTIIFFVLALAFSCSQDPIFFTISTETKPEKPRIPGGPTNMVVFDNRMYVASGRLRSYNSASGWDEGIQPGGKVIGLAATDEHLYALCIIGTGVTTILQRKGRTGEWTEIKNSESQYSLVQSIYAVNSGDRPYLFAGARNNSGINYGILCLDDTSPDPTLRLIVGDTEILSGAASRRENADLVYFLSTKGRGVYTISETDLSANTLATQLGGSENRLLMGMIKLYEEKDGPIIVIERDNGTFFEVRESGFRDLRKPDGTVSSGKFATGALAEWQQVTPNDDNDGIKMLIAGIQGSLFSTSSSSSYSHGYVEIELDTELTFYDDGWLVLSSSRGINPDITVDGNTDRYTATIGKHPINHFFQAPESIDSNRTFFASTQTAGLWSYRIREGGPQWNAEN